MVKTLSRAQRMELRRKIGNRTVTGPDAPRCFRGPVVLTAHACFTCRKSWKLPEQSTGVCPQCGHSVRYMGRAFRAPKRGDLAQWKKVEKLWRAGFRFPVNTRWREVEPYPERPREVDAFIRANRDHPFRVKD